MPGAEARPEQSRRSLDCHLSTSGCCPCPGTPRQGRMEDLGKLSLSRDDPAARPGLGSHFRGSLFLPVHQDWEGMRLRGGHGALLPPVPPPAKGPMRLVVRQAFGQKWSKLESRKWAVAAPQAWLHPVGAGSHPWPGVGEPGSEKQPRCWGHSLLPSERSSQGREVKAERESARPALGEVVLWIYSMGPG